MLGFMMLGAVLLQDPAAAGRPRCPVLDLMPQYWALQARAAPFEAYKRTLIEPNVQIYNPDLVMALRGDTFTAWEKDENSYAAQHRFAAQSVSRILADELPHYIDDFRVTFPKLTCDFAIYIAPSFGTMNAAAARTPSGLKIVFSPVTILQTDGDRLSQIKLLFDHELFHIYHAQASRGDFGATATNDAPLYKALWSEGLAVHVSQRQNDGVGRDRALLDITLAGKADAFRRDIARAVLQDLDSRDAAVANRYFSMTSSIGSFPPRSGYYIGALVADDLARGRSMEQLAALQDRAAHALIRSSLERIATARD